MLWCLRITNEIKVNNTDREQNSKFQGWDRPPTSR